jgi:methylated-DNA-[protein]-cysteine S-methyltransferase
MTCWHEIDSPVGPLLLAADTRGLTRIHFQGGPRPLQPPGEWRHDATAFAPAIEQLAEYFHGERRTFSLPMAPAGTTFQLSVWRALCAIPYGETVSYGLLARQLGLTNGARAVGLANGANPLPIIVPCHRVIGADGSLTGFGGGLPVKRALLSLEGAACVADLFADGYPRATAGLRAGISGS